MPDTEKETAPHRFTLFAGNKGSEYGRIGEYTPETAPESVQVLVSFLDASDADRIEWTLRDGHCFILARTGAG